MTYRTLPLFVFLAACSGDGNQFINPFGGPLPGLGATIGDPADSARRGQIELIVKTNYPGILDEIRAGGGPVLTRAMDAAGVPLADRPARVIQLQGDLGLYNANPGALVAALAVYGG